VYVEEIPSGVRTITGVATSITAFVGRTLRGPANDAVLINSFADFERRFGGLAVKYPLSYAVRDFYLNGGTQAIIVRLFADAAQVAARAVADAAGASAGTTPAAVATDARTKAKEFKQDPEKTAADDVAKAAEAKAGETPPPAPDDVKKAAKDAANATKGASTGVLDGTEFGSLKLRAAYPGDWGNNVSVKIDKAGIDDDVVRQFGLPSALKDTLFNMTVVENPPDGARERIQNVSLHPDAGARRIDRVLESSSRLVRVDPADLPTDPAAVKTPEVTKADEDPTSRATKPDKVKKMKGGLNSTPLTPSTYIGSQANKSGIYALEKADLFNLLCIPPDARNQNTDNSVYAEALQYCADRRAMLIVDPPVEWGANKDTAAGDAVKGFPTLGLGGLIARNAALYFPRVIQSDPQREGQLDTFVPCGMVAGVMARTDTQRGVWKAPAGIDATLNGVQALQVNLTDDENGMLNPLGVNCLRFFPPVIGRVIWGARTLRGADQLADEYKYVPVRRLALYIEESLYRGTQWVVFEPNDEPLWAQIRLNVGAFMQNLFRQGAFQGTTPRDAYFVKCDKETTTQNDINLGIVNIVVGFAPLKPAEFVIIKIQQIAGEIQT
jgi:phage tail sheath protein FI